MITHDLVEPVDINMLPHALRQQIELLLFVNGIIHNLAIPGCKTFTLA